MFWAQKCKNTKISQNLFIIFFQNLMLWQTWQRKEKWLFFHFSWQLSLCPKNPSLGVFGYKIDITCISCFVGLFFVIVLVLDSGVYCYFVFVSTFTRKRLIRNWSRIKVALAFIRCYKTLNLRSIYYCTYTL